MSWQHGGFYWPDDVDAMLWTHGLSVHFSRPIHADTLLPAGALAGFPLVDIRVAVIDATFREAETHPDDFGTIGDAFDAAPRQLDDSARQL